MPRRQRLSTAGLCFHVMNRAAKRETMFSDDSDYAAFERVLHMATADKQIALFSYCVMPNHWHLVLSPLADGQLSRFMHWVTTTHARRWQLSRGLDGHGAVYQGRFKALPIKDDHHFLWVCRYVERNPVRARLVERAEQWRWSSLGCGDDLKAGVVARWPISAPADWIAWVNAPQPYEQRELERFRQAMRVNAPFGDDAWQEAVASRLEGRRRRPRGQPSRRPASVLKK